MTVLTCRDEQSFFLWWFKIIDFGQPKNVIFVLRLEVVLLIEENCWVLNIKIAIHFFNLNNTWIHD